LAPGCGTTLKGNDDSRLIHGVRYVEKTGRAKRSAESLTLRRFSDAGTHDANHALRRPASEKRQGTKSRWGIVGGAATMGISSRAQASMWWNVAARGEILPRGICVN